MVEETKDPEKIFPKMMFTGLGIACLFYVLVVVAVVAVLPLDYDSGDEGSCCTSSNSARRRCRSTRSSRI